jgi:hypothetical protein
MKNSTRKFITYKNYSETHKTNRKKGTVDEKSNKEKYNRMKQIYVSEDTTGR